MATVEDMETASTMDKTPKRASALKERNRMSDASIAHGMSTDAMEEMGVSYTRIEKLEVRVLQQLIGVTIKQHFFAGKRHLQGRDTKAQRVRTVHCRVSGIHSTQSDYDHQRHIGNQGRQDSGLLLSSSTYPHFNVM